MKLNNNNYKTFADSSVCISKNNFNKFDRVEKGDFIAVYIPKLYLEHNSNKYSPLQIAIKCNSANENKNGLMMLSQVTDTDLRKVIQEGNWNWSEANPGMGLNLKITIVSKQ